MNKENCALKLVDEIIPYYDARSKKTSNHFVVFNWTLPNIPVFSHENSVSKMGFVSPKPRGRKVDPPRVPVKYEFHHILSTYSQKWNPFSEIL